MNALIRRQFALRSLVTAFVLAASALHSSTQPAAATEAEEFAAEKSVPVMLVLDASGSMTEADAPGLRIDAAKDAVKDLVTALPDEAQIGLMVYGTGTDSSPAAKPEGCEDIKTLSPVGPLDRQDLLAKVDSIQASGYTPIGASLRAADEEMTTLEGPRSIVLVSDGIDTCAPPPACEVAQELADKGIGLTVHSIGFKVDAKARAELECIADVTGGTYADAEDADTLSEEITVRTTRAMNAYAAEGTPIRGGASIADAVEVQPGQYVDQLLPAADINNPDPGVEKFYKARLERGERLHVATSLIRSQTDGPGGIDFQTIRIEPHDSEGGSTCGNDEFDMANSNNLLGGPPTAVFSSDVMGSGEDACYEEATGDVIFSVTRKGGSDRAVDVEIAVLVEPPADATALPEAHEEPTPLSNPTLGDDAANVLPGYTYGSATAIQAGTYSAAAVPNETHFYKVELDYGEQLAATLQLGEYARKGNGIGLQLNATNPLREAIDFAEGGIGYRDGIFATNAVSGTTLADSFAAPVRFNNRQSGNSKIQTLYLAGAYYILVSTDAQGNDEYTFEIPYTLSVAVEGSPEPGPELVSFEQAGPAPTAAEAIPSQDAEIPDGADAVAAGQDRPDSPLPWIVGAFGAVLLLAGIVIYLLRKRRPGSGQPGPS